MKPRFKTKLGKLYAGKVEEVLAVKICRALEGKVYLLFTSPPFLMNLYNYAWFVGFFVAFFAYGGFMTVVSKIKPATSW